MSHPDMNSGINVIQTNTSANTFWFFTGGQINHLKQAGFNIHAVTSPGPYFDRFRQREGITVFSVPMKRDIALFDDIISLLRFCKVTMRVKPAIMHGSTPKAGFISMLAARMLNVPSTLFFMRGFRSYTLRGWKRLLVKSMEKLTCGMADQVLCTSNSVRLLAIEEGLCKPEKIKVLHHGTGNGINTKRFDPNRFSDSDRKDLRQSLGIPDTAQVLLFVGRMVAEKGLVELVRAWETLKLKYRDLHLVLVGPWSDVDRLPQEAEYIVTQGHDRVHVLGRLEDVAPIFSISDIFVLPTYREGIPISALEASAMQLPVIATRIPGCVDAVEEGVTGVLIPPRDERAIVSSVSDLLEDANRRRAMGLKGRERIIGLFEPEAIWDALRQEYVDLLTKKEFFTSSVTM
ncbi:MAG: glycosyltransferase family 4 protein [Syntrophobacteraceae bacterium]